MFVLLIKQLTWHRVGFLYKRYLDDFFAALRASDSLHLRRSSHVSSSVSHQVAILKLF